MPNSVCFTEAAVLDRWQMVKVSLHRVPGDGQKHNSLIENKDKNFDIFHISALSIDCGYSLEPTRRGGSNEYPQSIFLSRDRKNNVYPCKPQFYYINVGFKEVNII